MISNERALEVIDKIDIYGDRYKIYRNPNYEDTVIVADITDKGEFHNIAIVTLEYDSSYFVQLVTPNKIENSYELSSNSDKYIQFPGQITEEIIKALYEENGLNYNPNDMNKLFTSNDNSNIVIYAFPDDSDRYELKWGIDSFMAYDSGSQTYQEVDMDTNGTEDCGSFYESEEDYDDRILTEDEYNYWLENRKR